MQRLLDNKELIWTLVQFLLQNYPDIWFDHPKNIRYIEMFAAGEQQLVLLSSTPV